MKNIIISQASKNTDKFKKLNHEKYYYVYAISVFAFLRMINLLSKLNRTDITEVLPKTFEIEFGNISSLNSKTEGICMMGLILYEKYGPGYMTSKISLGDRSMITIDSNFHILGSDYSLINDPYCSIINVEPVESTGLRLDMIIVAYDNRLCEHLDKNNFNYVIINGDIIIENARVLSLPGQIRSKKLKEQTNDFNTSI